LGFLHVGKNFKIRIILPRELSVSSSEGVNKAAIGYNGDFGWGLPTKSFFHLGCPGKWLSASL